MCDSDEEGTTFFRQRPIDEIEGHFLPYLALAYKEWALEVGDAEERASKFNVHIYENRGGLRILFLAKREPDERLLKGGRCRNGQDVQFTVTSDLKIERKNYFK
jgi:hypothetical protein